jgi:hypothetical protein
LVRGKKAGGMWLDLFFLLHKHLLNQTEKAIDWQPQPQKFNQPFLPILVEIRILNKKINQQIKNENAQSNEKD